MLKKLCLAALFALPAAAMAEGLSYKFIEADYLIADADGAKSVDGLGIGGTFLIAPQFFLNGGYSRFKQSGVEVSSLSGGLGYRHPLSPTVDFNGTANIVYAKAKVSGFGSDSDTGYSLGAGLRAQLAPQFELNGGVNYTDIADDGEVGFNLGGVFSFTPQVALVGGIAVGDDFGDDGRVFNIGARFMF